MFGGLIFGLIFGLFAGLSSGLIAGLIGGLAGGLSGGLMVGWLFVGREIQLTEIATWSWRKGLIFGLFAMLIVGPIFGLIVGLSGGLIVGLFAGLVVGLIGGLSGKLTWRELQVRSKPNYGVQLSGRNGFIIGLIFGLSGGLIFGLSDGLSNGLFFGLYFGLFFGLFFGGDAYLKHYLLRWLLARYKYLPFKLEPFLDEMVGRILLRKVGGGYIFIHRMLLEYFASLETTKPQTNNRRGWTGG